MDRAQKIINYAFKRHGTAEIVLAVVLTVLLFVTTYSPAQALYQGGTARSIFNENITPEQFEAYGCKDPSTGLGALRLGVIFLGNFGSKASPSLDIVKGCEIKMAMASTALTLEQKQVIVLDIMKEFKEQATQPVGLDYALLATDSLYQNKTASGIIYAQQMVDKITNPGKVYAQTPYFPGLGFTALEPIQQIWGWSVNFVYSFMIIIIISIAFAMLFQNTFTGKQSIQLQTAIPNIIFAMLLIPLSYPISGLAIDALTLGANMLHGVLLSGDTAIGRQFWEAGDQENSLKVQGSPIGFLQGSGEKPTYVRADENRGLYVDDPRISVWRAFTLIDASGTAQIITGSEGITGKFCGGATEAKIQEAIAAGVFPDGGSAADLNTLNNALQNGGDPEANQNTIVDLANKYSAGCGLIGRVNEIFSFINGVAGGGNYSIDMLLMDLIYLIFSVVAIFTAFRLFIMLFSKYIMYFLLLPMISPFVFASLALPGQGTKTIVWYLKRLFGTSAMFLFVYLMFMVSMLLSQANIMGAPADVTAASYNPPLLGFGGTAQGALGAVSSINLDGLLDLVAVGIFFGLPIWLKKFQEAIGMTGGIPSILKDVAGGAAVSGALAYQGTKMLERRGIQASQEVLRGYKGLRQSISPNRLGEKSLTEKNIDAAKSAYESNKAWRESKSAAGRFVGRTVHAAYASGVARYNTAGTGEQTSNVRGKVFGKSEIKPGDFSIKFINSSGQVETEVITVVVSSFPSNATTWTYTGSVDAIITPNNSEQTLTGKGVFIAKGADKGGDPIKLILSTPDKPIAAGGAVSQTLLINGNREFDMTGKEVRIPVAVTFTISNSSQWPYDGQVYVPDTAGNEITLRYKMNGKDGGVNKKVRIVIRK